MREQTSRGPDFSHVRSFDTAHMLFERGELERVLLLPAELGGPDTPQNVVLVPTGIGAVKEHVDLNIVAELVRSGHVRRYRATPRYQADSLVPVAIDVHAWDPGHFATTIDIWGNAARASALQR